MGGRTGELSAPRGAGKKALKMALGSNADENRNQYGERKIKAAPGGMGAAGGDAGYNSV